MSKKTTTVKTETIANNAAAPAPEVIQTAAAVSKASIANAVFKEMFAQNPVPARKDMIARAMQEAGLSPNGAATYLQNYKAKNGLVVKKTSQASA